MIRPEPMRVLRRFIKGQGHWAEIRERSIETLSTIEYSVFVDGSFLGGELFTKERRAEYLSTLEERIMQFLNTGWIEQPSHSDGRNVIAN